MKANGSFISLNGKMISGMRIMEKPINVIGKLYSNKNRTVFVATEKDSCPRINFTSISKSVRFRDDYSKGFKTSKSISKLVFK